MFCYCFYQYITFAKMTMSSQCADECYHYFLTNVPHFCFLCSPELNFLFIPRKFIQLNLWDLERILKPLSLFCGVNLNQSQICLPLICICGVK